MLHSRVAKWVGDHAIAVSATLAQSGKDGVQQGQQAPRLSHSSRGSKNAQTLLSVSRTPRSTAVVYCGIRGTQITERVYTPDSLQTAAQRTPPPGQIKGYKVSYSKKKAARDAKRSHDTRCPHGHPLYWRLGHTLHAHTLAHSLRRPRWRVGWKGNSIPFLRFLMNPDGTLL